MYKIQIFVKCSKIIKEFYPLQYILTRSQFNFTLSCKIANSKINKKL